MALWTGSYGPPPIRYENRLRVGRRYVGGDRADHRARIVAIAVGVGVATTGHDLGLIRAGPNGARPHLLEGVLVEDDMGELGAEFKGTGPASAVRRRVGSWMWAVRRTACRLTGMIAIIVGARPPPRPCRAYRHSHNMPSDTVNTVPRAGWADPHPGHRARTCPVGSVKNSRSPR